MDTLEQHQAQDLLSKLVTALDTPALDDATNQLRAILARGRAEVDEDDESGQADLPVVPCPYCFGYPQHELSCLVVRTQAFMSKAAGSGDHETGAFGLLLDFVTGNSDEKQLWGGVYYHEVTDWLCVYCRTCGTAYVTVTDEEQHRDDCLVLQAQAFLREVGQRHSAWPWRWQEAEDTGWSYHDGRWVRVRDETG